MENESNKTIYGEGRGLDLLNNLQDKLIEENKNIKEKIELMNKMDLKDIDYEKLDISDTLFSVYYMTKLDNVKFDSNSGRLMRLRDLFSNKPMKEKFRFFLPLFDLAEHISYIDIHFDYKYHEPVSQYGNDIIYLIFHLEFNQDANLENKIKSFDIRIMGKYNNMLHIKNNQNSASILNNLNNLENSLLDKLCNISLYNLEEDAKREEANVRIGYFEDDTLSYTQIL